MGKKISLDENEKNYTDNESLQGGFFPLGSNGCWHGGVHIPYEDDEGVYPIINGKLISYRLQEKDITCDLSTKITEYTLKNYSKFTVSDEKFDNVKSFYTPAGKNTLEKKDSSININLNAGSANYFLFLKEINLMKNSKLLFYTLYMHIAPFEKYLLKNKNCIFKTTDKNESKTLLSNIKNNVKENSPFYINWNIEIENPNNFVVTSLKKNNILPGTPFTVADENYFYHDFDTSKDIQVKIGGGDSISLPANTLDIKPVIENNTFEFKDIKGDNPVNKFLYKNIDDIDSLTAAPPLYTKEYSGGLRKGIQNKTSAVHPEYIQFEIDASNSKDVKDKRKIYEIGFLPESFLGEKTENNKKITVTDRDCYLRYPIKIDISLPQNLPSNFLKYDITNKKIYLNNKYVQYPTGCPGEEIFFPTQQVILKIKNEEKDSLDETFLYEVGIEKMNIFVHKDDIEDFKFDSASYKIKSLNHYIYIYDDKKSKYRISFSDEYQTSEGMELTKALLFGDSSNIIGKEFSSSNYKENSKTGKSAKNEKGDFDYVRIEFSNLNANFIISKNECDKKVNADKKNGAIKDGLIKFSILKEDTMKTTVFKQKFKKEEYLFISESNIPVESLSEDELEKMSEEYNVLTNTDVTVYAMTASVFLPVNTELEKQKNLITEEKNKDNWELVGDNKGIEYIWYPTKKSGKFFVNETLVTTEIQGIIKAKNDLNKDNYNDIANALLVKNNKNDTYPTSYIKISELTKKKLSKVPEEIGNKIYIQESNGSCYYIEAENQAEKIKAYVTNEFDENLIKDKLNKTISPNDCLGMAGSYMKDENFIHLSMFTDKEVENLDFNYLNFKDSKPKFYNLTEIVPTAQQTKEFMLTSHPVVFNIDKGNDFTDYQKVQLSKMDFYIHIDDMLPTEEVSDKQISYYLKSDFSHPVYLYDKSLKIDLNSTTDPSNNGLANIKKYFLNNQSIFYKTYCGTKPMTVGGNKKSSMKNDTDLSSKGYYRVTLENKSSAYLWINKHSFVKNYNVEKKDTEYIFDIQNVKAKNMPTVTLYEHPVYNYKTQANMDGVKIPDYTVNPSEKIVLLKKGNNYIEEKMYYAFSSEGKDYYIDEDGYKKTSSKKFKLKDFFTIPDEDNNGDLICDIGSILPKIFDKNEGTEAINTAKKNGIAIIMHDNKFEEQKKILRTLCCKFPFEWDKKFYADDKMSFWKKNVDLIDEEYKVLQKIMEKSDIKQDLEKIDSLKGKDLFYHYNPFYFLGILNKLGLLGINPYANEENKAKLVVPADWKYVGNIKYGSPGGKEVLNSDPALNNPGCAPFIEKNGTEEYAKLTGVFNEDYLNVARSWNNGVPVLYSYYRTKYHHFGVDFYAEKGTRVKSFICGKVVAKGWISTNGRCLLIQGKSNNYLYMLCHLNGYPLWIEEGKTIMPGDVIAYTGTSGVKNGICSEDVFINAAHLHVSVLKYDKELVCSDCLYKVQRGGTTEPSFKWKIELNYVDPFDYERPYKGLVSIPGRE